MTLLARVDLTGREDTVAAAISSTAIRYKSKQCRIPLACGGTLALPFYTPTALLDLRATQDSWFFGMKRLKPG